MMHPLYLHPARPADTSALLALWLKLTIQAHPSIPPGYWRASLPWVRDAYLPEGQTWLATDRGRIGGFICILPGHLLGALFVARRYRGRGVAQRLMHHAKRHHPWLLLEAYCANRRAQAFYRRQGFHCIDRQIQAQTGQAVATLLWQRGAVLEKSERLDYTARSSVMGE
ncbi:MULTISPECIES: N-acetyltransferase [Edwardsiella]|uniref:Acetyltransferase, GNAT family n=2 Tax=Edwardsiella anguillarum TaxID=1821960 RepID=A0A076LNP9_9GAMM|nr:MULTISPECIES: N-acetyltransferase [Edwardsiella]AKM46387.1 acetyltransferase [Edwardsiella sp. EA181011]AIJ08248.1 acetyltransferase, GNAT family [Edwardsiella anguillarum ET080813]AKR76359.1 N-acetyltransferase [Edwardsiella sp. LADL05-105]KAB0591683.1 N-acetyltransferase [Edwardsiella anguillarum]RFT04179.1 N-acetyltransferase [Edwardsiella anguillarum]